MDTRAQGTTALSAFIGSQVEMLDKATRMVLLHSHGIAPTASQSATDSIRSADYSFSAARSASRHADRVSFGADIVALCSLADTCPDDGSGHHFHRQNARLDHGLLGSRSESHGTSRGFRASGRRSFRPGHPLPGRQWRDPFVTSGLRAASPSPRTATQFQQASKMMTQ